MKWIIQQLRTMRVTNLLVYIGLFWSASAMFYISLFWHIKGDFTFDHAYVIETVVAGLLVLFAVVKCVLWFREAIR